MTAFEGAELAPTRFLGRGGLKKRNMKFRTKLLFKIKGGLFCKRDILFILGPSSVSIIS